MWFLCFKPPTKHRRLSLLQRNSEMCRICRSAVVCFASEVRDCGKLIQTFKERGIQQMCCFVILLLFNEMQMSVRRFSAIPHLRAREAANLTQQQDV